MFNKMSLYRVKKGFVYLRYFGPKEFLIRLKERIRIQKIDYEKWYENHRRTEEELKSQRQEAFAYAPLISIVVPVYQAPEEFLRQMIESLIVQTYSNWELCIVNASPDNEEMQKVLAEYSAGDSRVRFCNLKENLGIAENTNRAFAMTKGEFVGLLDHDDLLAPNALYEIVKILQDHPQADALYTDEDKVTTELDEHFQPHLKPDFNLDLLRSNNYICHFSVFSRKLLEGEELFRTAFDGAQDHDMILRLTDRAQKIVHVPRLMYYWRSHAGSTAASIDAKPYAIEAAKGAVADHLKKHGFKHFQITSTRACATIFRIRYQILGDPKISIVIANKDHVEDLKRCITSIQKNSTWSNYEIIVVENNSTTPEIRDYYSQLLGLSGNDSYAESCIPSAVMTAGFCTARTAGSLW